MKSKIVITSKMMVLRLCFGKCVLPPLLSTQTVSLHTTKAYSNVIGQHYWGYETQTIDHTNHSFIKFLSFLWKKNFFFTVQTKKR